MSVGSLTRRELLKWMGLAATSSALVACTSPSPTAPAPSATTAPAGDPKPAGKKVTVVWTFWGTNDPAFIESQRKLAQPFMDTHPAITVDPVPISSGYDEKIMTMLAGGAQADSVKVAAEALSNFVVEGALRPLGEFLDKDKAFSLDSFYKHGLRNNCLIVGGKLYGLPNGDSIHVVFFNAKMFQEAGLTDPRELQAKGTWTQDAYFEAAKKLAKGEGANRVFGTAAHLSAHAHILQWMHMNGGNFFDKGFTECVVNRPEAVNTLQRLADLVKNKIAPNAQDQQAIGSDSAALSAGKLAMEPDYGIWEAVTLKKIKDFEWDAVAMPRGSVDGSTCYNPHGYTVPKACKVPEEAWEFDKFITGAEVEKSFIVDGSYECKHPANEQFFLENAPVKNRQVFIDGLKEGRIFTPALNPRYREMSSAISSQIELVLNGEKTVQQAMDTAKATVDKLIKEVRDKWPDFIPVVE